MAQHSKPEASNHRSTEAPLPQAAKMDAIGEIAGRIAHDFNNLLMIIGANLELLNERVAPDDRTGRLFTAARLGVSRGVQLTEQLLTFSRRQDLCSETVDAESFLGLFRRVLEDVPDRSMSVAVSFAPVPPGWFCVVDPRQLQTAISNIVRNAYEAMPRGGRLTLSLGERKLDGRTSAALGVVASHYAVISLADTGTGIDPQLISRVFEPFFTTKGAGKEKGMGLSQVYGFARQSGGFVTISSTPEQGTTVLLHLPGPDALPAACPQSGGQP